MAISVRPGRGGSRTRRRRSADGKAARQRVPRSAHARWVTSSERRDPLDILGESAQRRVPALVPIWYGRMSLSPFAFYRGSADVMAHDLAGTPEIGARVQLCGDAHMNNFGVFATPERDRVFDVNDFDETLPGPWEWDVKRLATSLVLAARHNRLSRDDARWVTGTALRVYRGAMTEFGRARYLDTWYAHIDRRTVAAHSSRAETTVIEEAVRRARRRTVLHAFPKLVREVHGRYRIRDDPPLIVHYRSSADERQSRAFYDRYLDSLPPERRVLLDRYHVADVAQKVVGVGSVGTVCAVLLLLGDTDVEDPLFLQLKEARASVLEPLAGASPYDNHAQRVVVGQHLIQESSDIFLGWSRLRSRDFYIRQLRDMKFSADVQSLRPRTLLGWAELCGATLARAHARTGDPAFIAGYLGNRPVFDLAVTAFAEAYADQVEQDYAQLLRAIRRGRLRAEVDV